MLERETPGPPRQCLRQLHLEWSLAGIPSGLRLYVSSGIGPLEHAVSAAAPGSNRRLQTEEEGQRPDPGPVHIRHSPWSAHKQHGRDLKKPHSRSWHLIRDHSFPEWESVNDGIDPAICSLKYPSVERISQAMHSVSRGP